MRLSQPTTSDGVAERLFTVSATVDDISGALWAPTDDVGGQPLIVMGHGGGQHKHAPSVVALARLFVLEGGFSVLCVDAPAHGDRTRSEEHARLLGEMRERMNTGGDPALVLAEFHTLLAGQSVPEWLAVVDAIQDLAVIGPAPVCYWGVSLGCALGVPYVAADQRVRAAVLGLCGIDTAGAMAPQVNVPLEFLVQWDDELVPRSAALALFDSFASTEKSLHANPGGHRSVPAFETDSSLRFFARHLSRTADTNDAPSPTAGRPPHEAG